MSYKRWKSKILAKPGAKERVATIKAELLQAAGLTDLREQAGLSQRELADRIGVKQPRVAAIEKADNVRLDVLVRYLEEVGAHLEVVKGKRRMPLRAASVRKRPVRGRSVGTGDRTRTRSRPKRKKA